MIHCMQGLERELELESDPELTSTYSLALQAVRSLELS